MLNYDAEYIHYKNKQKHYILEFSNVKIQEEGEWVKAVIYSQVGSKFRFVRSEKEFKEKFTEEVKRVIF